MTQNKSIGQRMKENYEYPYRYVLPNRMPIIVRLDGRAFHTLTADMYEPFNAAFINNMAKTAKYLVDHIGTARLAYVQSDEISILLINYNKLNSEPFFG